MKPSLGILIGWLGLAATLPASAQHVVGLWYLNEGSGANAFNSSPHTTNWNMTLSGNPALWGYWQPGAYAFAAGFGANKNNFRTDLTAAAAWTSGDHLRLTADVNVTTLVNNPGLILKGGTVFGTGYFIPGGNSLGYNLGAFYASVDTLNPGNPSMKFGISGIPPGEWSRPLPTSVTDININGGWNTFEWEIVNDALANTMSVQFRLNGTNLGAPITFNNFYLRDFTDWPNYTGTKFYIGAQADGDYNTFTGSIRNVSLVAYVPEPAPFALMALGTLGFTLIRRRIRA